MNPEKSRNTVFRLYNIGLHSDDVKLKTRNSKYGQRWFPVENSNWLSIFLVLLLWKRSGGLVGSTTNILGQSNSPKFRENVSTHPRFIVVWISRPRIDVSLRSHIARPDYPISGKWDGNLEKGIVVQTRRFFQKLCGFFRRYLYKSIGTILIKSVFLSQNL
jgi:hypothetical protein